MQVTESSRKPGITNDQIQNIRVKGRAICGFLMTLPVTSEGARGRIYICRENGMTSTRVRTLVLALTFVGLATSETVAGDQRVAATVDSRQRITLPANGRVQILAEMRGMLESVRAVLFALSSHDMPAVERAARASAVDATANPDLDRVLPEGFLRFRLQTHQAFQALADHAHANGPEVEVIKELATITNNCVGCHGAFRVVEGPAPKAKPR